jgi:tetratricopeptide (TPR) repeat protein
MTATVSLCMIVKNEEANLGPCLEGVGALVDEIVIVDTGSTDRTRDIAAERGAVIVDFPWRDDFSAARNEALRHSAGDWIFWLDADDRVDAANPHRLSTLLAALPDENIVYLMRCISTGPDGATPVNVVDHPRLFRRQPGVVWSYRVHEQVLPSILRSGARLQRSDVVIHHRGYSDRATCRRKDERNLRLLRLDAADHPEDHSVLFHLGMTLVALDQPAEGVPHLEQVLRQAPEADPTIRKSHALITQGLRRLGRMDEALARCRQALERFPEDTELLFQESVLCVICRDLVGAERTLLRLLTPPPGEYIAVAVDPDLRGVTARFNLGVVYRDQGRLADAEAQWRQVLAERPGMTEARVGLAELYLATNRRDDAERLATELPSTPEYVADVAAVQARAHLHARDVAAALAVLDEAISRLPQFVALRVARSHVLLVEDRDHAAAEQAVRDVLALEPNNLQARNNLDALLRHSATLTTAQPRSAGSAPQGPVARGPCEGEREHKPEAPDRGAQARTATERAVGTPTPSVSEEPPLRDDPQALWSESQRLEAAGDVEGAERHLRKLVPIVHDPRLRSLARHHLALLCRGRKQFAEAEALWLALLGEQPAFAVGWLELAELYLTAHKWVEVEKIVERVAGLGRAEDAIVLRSRSLLFRKEYAAARQLLQDAIRQWPRALRPWQALSHVLLFEGRDPTAAEAALRDLLALDPSNVQARDNLARLLARRQ